MITEISIELLSEAVIILAKKIAKSIRDIESRPLVFASMTTQEYNDYVSRFAVHSEDN